MRLAYKAFNADLTCTMGRGTFQYEPGKWYEESEANCVKNGFHCAANPLDTMNYYSDWDRHQYWMVAIDGDIDEDGTDTKISATRIRLVKRLNLEEFLCHAIEYITEHPHLKMSHRVHTEDAKAKESDKFLIVRNGNPKAMGTKAGQYIALIKGEEEVEAAGLFLVGNNAELNTWIDVEGRPAC